MRIAICDDEAAQREYLAQLAGQWGEQRGEKVSLSLFPDGKSFLFRWEEEQGFDLLLLDIEMAEMSGMELARRLRRDRADVAIIFITGYAEYMAQGYDVRAIHYLLKPVDKERLFAAMDCAMEETGRRGQRCIFVTDEGEISVTLQDILYAEAFGHACVLHLTGGRQWKVKKSMADLEVLLGRFAIDAMRSHRSYLVNLEFVAGIFREEAVLDDGSRIPVSRKQYREFHEAFLRHFHRPDILRPGKRRQP